VMIFAMAVSVASFLAQGVVASWGFLGVELLGVVVGAIIGPRTQKFIREVWLKRVFVILALYVGIRYVGLGFFSQRWLP
jgi:uncharacterized protein